jgi:hypothetical protein
MFIVKLYQFAFQAAEFSISGGMAAGNALSGLSNIAVFYIEAFKATTEFRAAKDDILAVHMYRNTPDSHAGYRMTNLPARELELCASVGGKPPGVSSGGAPDEKVRYNHREIQSHTKGVFTHSRSALQ